MMLETTSTPAPTRAAPEVATSVRSEPPAPSRMPLLVPQLPEVDALLPYLRQIDANRWYTNFGPLVRSLEGRLADSFAAVPAPGIVSAANGTAALEMALGALELPAGARVLVPALTFVATATAVLRAGYQPVIADVDADSWLLEPPHAEQAMHRQAIDAVMPVATFGTPQDTGCWDRFTETTGLPVVIDAAGAFGNQGVGRHGQVVFSLHATKALAAGEGGFIVSRQPELIERARRLSNFGIDLKRGALVFAAGENGKMSEYHAAVAHAAMDRWPAVAQARVATMARYRQILAEYCPQLRFQAQPPGGVYPILVTLLPPFADAREVLLQLAAQGIESRQWYCPTLDQHPAFARYCAVKPSTAHALAHRLIGLPFFIDITERQMRQVGEALRALLDERAR